MSRTNGTSRTGKKRANFGIKTGDWQGFVDIPLNEGELAAVRDEHEHHAMDLLGFLVACIDDGYKVSIAPHSRGASVIATLTGRDPECVNAGYSLSGFGPDVEGALLSVYYKHVVLCEKLRWADQPFTTRQQLSLWG
jgi:hypothetical protein